MIPVLYSETETDFLNNGLGLLVEAVSCDVEEERNGKFELTLTYPQNGRKYNDLVVGNYIKAKPNDRDDPQPFRIYKVGKPVAGVCTYYGEHISYELGTDPVPNFTANGKTPQEAVTKMIEDAVVQKPYTAWSDITTRKDMKIHGVYNVRNLLGGLEGSLIDTYGGELQFDKYTVKLHAARGRASGISIRYGKNLIDAEMEKNIEAVATAIYPYAWYTPETVDGTEAEEVLVSLTEKVVMTPNAANYSRTYCVPVDFSDSFGDTVPTEAALRTKANAYVQKGIDIPKVSIRLSYVDLTKTKDYENLFALENVGLCDTVTVVLDRLGITETAKVVRTNYNVLRERYNEIEVGEIRPSLVSEVNIQLKDTFRRVIRTATRSEVLKQQMEKRILAVTAAITGNSGGYVVLYPAENPQEILIMDTDDTATATNVWRWNMAGLGHSSTGINGPFTTAITAAGEIVADFITAGELDGQIIKAGSIQAESLDVRYKQSVTTYIDDGLDALHEEMESRFQVTDSQITAEVSRAQQAEAANASQIQLNANAISLRVTSSQAQSLIDQSADTIRLKANNIVWNSTKSSMTSEGVLTCTGAKFNDGTITSTNGQKKATLENGFYRGYLNNSISGLLDLCPSYADNKLRAALWAKDELFLQAGGTEGNPQNQIKIDRNGLYGNVYAQGLDGWVTLGGMRVRLECGLIMEII